MIPDRPRPTDPQKTAAWNRENGICYLCGKPVAPKGEGVRYDHRDMREISANDSVENLYPTHPRCHTEKTSDHDAPRLAKVRRQEGLTKPKVHKAGGFRRWRKFNGEIVERKR